MLDGLVSEILSHVLGNYVDGIDHQHIQLGIRQGKISLQNLRLSRNVFHNFGIPFDTPYGLIKNLEIEIPWSNLLSKPLQIRINGVYILAQPHPHNSGWKQKATENEEQKQKQKDLQKLEEFKRNQRSPKEGTSSIADRVVEKLLEQLTVHITNVHIRIEFPANSFAAGITLQDLTFKSSDLQQDTSVFAKEAMVDNISAYWNSEEPISPYDTQERFIEVMEKVFSEKREEFEFVLVPLGFEVAMLLSKTSHDNILQPKIDVKTILEHIKVELHEKQYNQLLRVIHWVTQYNLREKKLPDIPDAPIREEPLAHWKYLLTNQLKKARKIRSRLTKEYIDERRATRIQYSKLWKEHILTKSFMKSSELKKLEEKLSFEDIAYFRIRAEAEIRPSDLPSSTWSSWCLSWVTSGGVDLPEQTQQKALSEENLNTFYEAIGVSNKASQKDTQQEFEFKLRAMVIINNITLVIKGLDMKKQTLEICRVNLKKLFVEARKFQNLSSVDMSLDDVEVLDGWTENCFYPKIVCRGDRDTCEGSMPGVEIDSTKLLTLHFDGDTKTTKLRANVQSLDIVVNARWIRRLTYCFKKLNTIDPQKHIGASIWQQIEAMRRYGLIQLRYAMEGSKELSLDINIADPRIILPEEASSSTSAALLIDAGKIQIFNEKRKKPKKRTADHTQNWKEHLYQEYRLQIEHFRMTIVTSADGNLRNKKSRKLPFWEDCDGEFSVEVLTGSDGYGMIPKIRVSSLLPKARIFLSGLIMRDFVRVMLAMVEDEVPPNFPPLVEPMEVDEPRAEDVMVSQGDCVYPHEYDPLNTRVFELHLAYQTASATFLRDTTDENEKLEVVGRLVTEGLIYQYQYRNVDMFVYFAAHSAVIEDHYQDTGERFHFMASDIPEGAQVGHFDLDPHSLLSENKSLSGSPLISFYFEKKAKAAPDYRHIENELYISFKQLYVNLNRRTVAAIYEILNVGMMSDGKHKKHRQLLRLRRNGMKVNLTAKEIKALAKIDSAYELLLEDKEHYISDESDVAARASHTRKPPAPDVFFYVSLGFQRGSVVLNDNGKNYAVIGICKCDVNVYQKDDFMDIRCSLPSLVIEALQEKYHRRVVNINSFDRPMMVVYRKYLRKYANFPGCENKIRIRASSVELTLLQSFFFRLTYFMKEIGTIYNELKEKSVLRLDKEEKEKTVKRKAEGLLRFEIEFDSTFIRLPRNSINAEFVQLELHDGMIKNEAFLMFSDDSDNSGVLGERCTLDLTSASGSVGDTISENLYPSLPEANLFLQYERAITDTPDDALPFIPFRVYAKIPSLHVKATEHHYGIIVSTLMQQLDEYFLRCDHPPQAPQFDSDDDVDDSEEIDEYIEDNYDEFGENKEELNSETSGETSERDEGSLSLNDSTLVISLSIDTLYAEILKEYDSDEDSEELQEDEESDDDKSVEDVFDDDDFQNELDKYEQQKENQSEDMVMAKAEHKSESPSESEISPIDTASSIDMSEDEDDKLFLSQALGVFEKFEFVWISTKSSGVRMKISIDEIEVVDSRAPCKNKFVQLWHHPSLDNEPHMTYEYLSDGQGHMKMSVDIKKIELVFIPLTYRVLAFFFTNPYVSITLPLELATSIAGEPKETLNNPPLHRKPTKDEKTPNTDLLFYSDINPSFSVSVVFSDASVIFPTNWDLEDSRGTILYGGMIIQTRSFRDIFGIALNLSNVDGVVCSLRKRDETEQKLIEGLNVSYINTNVADLVELTINVDAIKLRTTYRDLLSVLGIIKCVTPPNIQRDKHMKGTAHNDTESSSGVYHSMDIRTGGIAITIIDEDHGNSPIFCLRGYVFTVDRENSINGDSSVAIKVQFDGYNRDLACWEPIIEPWENITSVSIMPIIGTTPPKSLTKIQILSKEICNINLSQYFYQLMQKCWAKWNTEEYLLSRSQTNYSIENDLIIKNYTGMKVTVRSADDDSCDSLDVGDSLFLPDQSQSSLSVQLEGGWKEINDLPTDSLGHWVVALHPAATNCSPCLHWNIEQTASHERTITLSSNVFIKNHCSDPIAISLRSKHRGELNFILEAKTENPIPVQLAKSCSIYLKPDNDDDGNVHWSIRSIDCLILSESSGIIQCPNRNGLPHYFAFHITKSIVKGRNVIHILAPIVVENQLTHDLRLKVFGHETEELTREVTIPASKCTQLFHHAECSQIDISFSFGNYSECEKTQMIRSRSEENFPTFWMFDEFDRPLLISSKKEVDKHGREVVMIYASYWLVNKTGLPLFYKRKAFRGHSRGTLAPGQPSEDDIKNQDSIETLNVSTSDQSQWYDTEEELGIGEDPLMFSYASLDLFKPRTSVKICDSEWSKAVGLESIGTSGEIIADDNSTSIQYRLGVSIELLSERYFRTKVISFRPRYILVNRTNREIYYTQTGTDFAHLLRNSESLPFHWLDRDKKMKLSVTLSPHHTWSGGFAIDSIGEFAVKIRSKSKLNVTGESSELNYGRTYLARIEIQLHKATFFVIIKKQADRVPPYQLENYTDLEIHYYQKIHGAEPQTLAPRSAVPYTWDNASGVHKLVIDIPRIHYQKIMKMDKIKSNKSEEITVTVDGKEIKYVGQVIAKGPSRILRIFQRQDAEDSKELKLKEGESDLDPTVTFQLFLKFRGIGISLVDSKPQEIIYSSFLGLQMEYANSERHQSFEITLDDLQIDNQLYNAKYPVLLSQAKTQEEKSQYLEDKCLHFSVILSNFYTSILYFHYISFLLQELNLRVDDAVVNTFLDFFGWEIGAIHESNFKAKNEELMIEPGETFRKLYIALLHINSLKCNITLSYTEEENEDQQSNKRNHVKNYLSTVRATVSNIENAPLSMQALLLENVFNTRPELVGRISKHYYQQILWDIHKIIGSFDLIGNPVNLVTNLGTGVHDFFYEPIHGFVSSPRDFLDGLHKGSTSLAKNSVSGIFNTISELTGTLGRGVAHLTFDKEYMRQRQKDSADAPQNPAEGFGKGLKEFGKGIYKGLTGIVRTPYHEAKDQGAIGLVKGTGKGLVGAVVKPTVGFVDIAIRTTQGVKNAASFSSIFSRVRPPRAFGPDHSMGIYDVNDAIGQLILRNISSELYSEDWYIAHYFPRSPFGILIISNHNVLFIDCNRSPYVKWNSSLFAIEEVLELDNSVVLRYYKLNEEFNLLSEPKQKRLTMVQFDFSDARESHLLYEQLRSIIHLIHRFELSQTDIVFSNKFIL